MYMYGVLWCVNESDVAQNNFYFVNDGFICIYSCIMYVSTLTCVWLIVTYIICLQLYTVVRNVRQAHECLEIGESQQFFDEVHYLLDSVKPSQPLGVRCLG